MWYTAQANVLLRIAITALVVCKLGLLALQATGRGTANVRACQEMCVRWPKAIMKMVVSQGALATCYPVAPGGRGVLGPWSDQITVPGEWAFLFAAAHRLVAKSGTSPAAHGSGNLRRAGNA